MLSRRILQVLSNSKRGINQTPPNATPQVGSWLLPENVRHLVSGANPAPLTREVIKVSEHLMYHRYQPNNTGCGSRAPLVLFLPWLTANEKSARKFEDLYGARGFDVLTVWGRLKHFAWPRSAFPLAEEVLTYLRSAEAADSDTIVVHAMSVGAYIYSVILLNAAQNEGSATFLRRKIKGNVFDSVVCGGLKQMAVGVAKTAVDNVSVQWIVRNSVLAYLSLTRSRTVALYDEAIRQFVDNPYVPSALFLYSSSDVMSDSAVIEGIMTQWEEQGRRVHHKKWTDSNHTEHLRKHRREYLEAVDAYLTLVGAAAAEKHSATPKTTLTSKL